MTEIRLDTERGCQDELQRCSNGIASLIHEFTRAVERQAELGHEVARVESIATVEVANNFPKITATEMKARVAERLDKDHRGLLASNLLNDAKVTALTARIRALEKRMSAAQSSLNQHQAEARSAGLAGR
jgi:hypothetical protein